MEIGQYQETFLNTLLALVAAGIFFAYNFVVPMNIAIIISVVALIAAVLMTWQSNKFTFIPFCILFFMLGLLRFQSVNVLPANDISNFAGDQVYVSGTIREQPRIILNADNTYSVRYIVDVETIKTGTESTPAAGGMYINAHYDSENKIPDAEIGYKISAFGNLRKPTNYNNPGQIDVVTQLKSDGITATLSSGKMGVEVEYIEGSYFTKFMRLMASIREHYKESMRQVMSNQDAAAIFAMLFGGYEGLKPELTESFVTTGIVHILSVSGSHMSLLAVTTAWLCNLF
ncbi:MAG: ComEC family competence protein, partial [Selenomonadaceae bacterium]|nr:ComEC family competence protein [Selenomonadaceae bacterium]